MAEHGNAVDVFEGADYCSLHFADDVYASFDRKLDGVDTPDGVRAFLAANRGRVNVLEGTSTDGENRPVYTVVLSKFTPIDVTDLV